MNDQRFAAITEARRVWAIGAIHGEAARLERMHELIAERFEPGDCIVYLGNMLGRGPDVATTVDMLLEFRSAVMAVDPREAASVFFLRGSQEEMWQKLLQLQFATNPKSDPDNCMLVFLHEQPEGTSLPRAGSSNQFDIAEGRVIHREKREALPPPLHAVP